MTSNRYNVRPFNPTDEEYQAIVDVYNADWPDDPATVSTWQHEDANRDKRYLFLRYVVEVNNKIVVEGCYGEDDWSYVPGKYFFAYSLHPDHHGAPIQQTIYEYVMEQLATREPAPTSIWGYSREDKPVRNDFLLATGFTLAMREPRSILDVTSFDHSRFDGAEEKAHNRGLELMSLADYQALDTDWQRKYWEGCSEIERDVPSTDPVTPSPFEEFIKSFGHPHFRADAHFIVVDKHSSDDITDWEIVGLSQISVDPNIQDKVHTWLTGVRRAYRRLGLATALKLRAIRFVQTHGARYIETGNEENNPMYNINMTLGFEPQPAWLEFQKPLSNQQLSNQ
ncbi:MAG: GNAT family N-acetyltransferase [Chloroflexota bacterium]